MRKRGSDSLRLALLMVTMSSLWSALSVAGCGGSRFTSPLRPQPPADGAGGCEETHGPVLPPLPPRIRAHHSSVSLPEGITRSETGRLFCSRDGAEMVLIPDTEFWMGSETGGREESPVHRVRLSAFLVDRHEVTNRQFARFVDDTGYQTDAEKQGWGHSSQSGTWATQGATWRAPLGAGSNIQGRDAYPVTLVSWNDAQAYCRWAGKRLLTEAEFEMLLRGGLEGLDYPWGDTWPPPDGAGNFADECLREVQPEARGVIDGYRDGFWALSPVATFTQNSYGVFDISGNVAEWCGDWFAHEYYRVSPLENPRGPVEGGHRVCRGRGWGYSTDDNLRSSFRDALSPDYRADTVGFRCAKDL